MKLFFVVFALFGLSSFASGDFVADIEEESSEILEATEGGEKEAIEKMKKGETSTPNDFLQRKKMNNSEGGDPNLKLQ